MLDYASELLRFLADEKQRVLVLEGPWGIGKTFYWKRFLLAHQAQIKEQQYSYVSLFGISSLDSLKGLLLVNANRSGHVGEGNALAAARKGIGRLAGVFRNVEIPWIRLKVDAVLPNIEELLIKDFLICFDDIERRNKRLEIDELLGLIARLKDEHFCRIVLIFNSGELEDTDRESLARFREKIIDRHITYAPRIVDNLRLVFGNPEAYLIELFERLELNNIRIMQQTQWALQYFQEALGAAIDTVRQGLLEQIVKLAIVHYAYAKVMNVRQMQDTNWMVELWHENQGTKKDERTLERLEIIKRLQYNSSDIDAVIVEYLEHGYTDPARVKEIVQKLNRNLLLERGKQIIFELWGLVYENFQTSAEEISRRFSKCMKESADTLDLWSLQQFCEFLDGMNIPYDREELQTCFKRRIQAASATELRGAGEIRKWPPYIAEMIAKRQEETATRVSLDTLVKELSGREGWNPRDFLALAEYSEDELFSWISSSTDDGLLYSLKELLKRAKVKGGGAEGTGVLDKLESALVKIGAVNSLNAYRVKRYIEQGIE